jgi:hypothetical protein
MAGTDSCFSAPNSAIMSNGSVGHVVNFGQANDGNINGDKVDRTEGKNTLIEDGYNGMFKQSTVLTSSIQYNSSSLYPKS